MIYPPPWDVDLFGLSDDLRLLGDYPIGPVKVSAKPLRAAVEINGAPVIETAHEFVMRKQQTSASDK